MKTRMMNTVTVPSEIAGVEIEGLESLLAEMDDAVVVEEPGVEDENVEDVSEDDVPGTADEADLAAVVGEIANSEDKAAAYAEQESTSTLDPDAATAPEVVAGEKPAKAPREKKASSGVTRTRGSIADLPGESFVLVMDDAARNGDEVKAEVLALRPSAKKIAEKFENLFLALNAGKLPSVYTVEVFKALRASALTSGEIVKALEGAGYSLGTSRSQAQQVIQLFSALKVTNKVEGKTVINPDSVIAVAIGSLIDAAPVAVAA